MARVNTKPEDDQLIQDTLAGHVEAFGQLVQKHQPALMDMAARIMGNKDEAEDVVQQVFIDAYRHLAEFRHGSQFFTWLYSIALNRARNQLRQRHVRRQVSLDDLTTDTDQKKAYQLPDSLPTPEQTLEHQLNFDWMMREIKNLSNEYQSIFILYYFHQLPLIEVARRVGRPLSTVKVYLYRARQELLTARNKGSGVT